MISPTVQNELSAAPDPVESLADGILADAEVVVPGRAEFDLADAYLRAGVVTERWLMDARHVATAVVAECEVIVSWSFRHIVHFDKIPKYNAVSVLNGHLQIAIHSPAEVLHYG